MHFEDAIYLYIFREKREGENMSKRGWKLKLDFQWFTSANLETAHQCASELEPKNNGCAQSALLRREVNSYYTIVFDTQYRYCCYTAWCNTEELAGHETAENNSYVTLWLDENNSSHTAGKLSVHRDFKNVCTVFTPAFRQYTWPLQYLYQPYSNFKTLESCYLNFNSNIFYCL